MFGFHVVWLSSLYFNVSHGLVGQVEVNSETEVYKIQIYLFFSLNFCYTVFTPPLVKL